MLEYYAGLEGWFDPSVTEKNDLVYIDGLNYRRMQRYFTEMYGSHNFYKTFFGDHGMFTSATIHRFYVPELIYILTKAADEGYDAYTNRKLVEELTKNTWFRCSTLDVKSEVDLNVLKKLKRKPLEHQLEFLRDVYWQKKIQYNLNGYLLAFDQGLGKGYTSIALTECLHKNHAIVIGPLSVINNVWPVEIEDTVNDVTIWKFGDNPDKLSEETAYVLCNYDNIAKLQPLVAKVFRGSETILIVDECHNFKDANAKRTKELIELKNTMNFSDILLMSGTPIKALGAECIPIFKVLDPLFNRYAEDKLKELNRYVRINNELLHNRFGMIMYRKLKEDVLALPPKHEEDLKIKLPDGKEYTFNNIKHKVAVYREERRRYYAERYAEFEKQFFDILEYYEKNILNPADVSTYRRYRKDLTIIKSKDISSALQMQPIMDIVEFVNDYENNIIIPQLPSDMRKTFRQIRTVYKYVELKILGEVIGNLLNQLRMEMTSKLIGGEVMNIIESAEKKTILFSSYIDSLEQAETACKKYGFTPMVITGEHSSQVKQLLDTFKSNPKINPLIASIKVLSTGHTIVEANTVIFLNVPYRSVDYQQASDRVYRIGQDADVYIYKLLLDTGEEPNLSTRMHDILTWSKEQFGAIIEGEIENDEVNNVVNQLCLGGENIFNIAKKLINIIPKLFK